MVPRRVMVVGGPGSGKSTLARAIGAKLDLPVVHFDRLQWLPGWAERDRAERNAMMRAEAAKAAWVIDGNYSVTLPERVARADLIVWLDLPLPLRLFRVYWRVVQSWRGIPRPDMTEGCPEKVDREFLGWILSSRARVRRRYFDMMAGAGAGRMVRLRSPRAVRRWLEAV